jgi:hypothetical protein
MVPYLTDKPSGISGKPVSIGGVAEQPEAIHAKILRRRASRRKPDVFASTR